MVKVIELLSLTAPPIRALGIVPRAVLSAAAILALVLVTLTLGASARAQQPATATGDAIGALEDELAQVQARKARWQKVVDQYAELSRDPGRYARPAELAGRELQYLGRELSVEGLTFGLSSYFSLVAKALKDEKKLAKGFKVAAAGVTFAHKAFIKDMARNPDKHSEGAIRLLESTDAGLKLIATAGYADPNIAAIIKLSSSFGTQGVKWLSAYVRGDQKSVRDHLPAIKTVLSTVRDMTGALREGVDPLVLEDALQRLAVRFPKLKPLAQLAAATALTDFYISLSLANVAWGSYAYVNGTGLLQQAEDIRRDQRRAAVILAKLIPLARAELTAARARERYLNAAIEGTGPQPPPPPRILPSRRFLDDGLGIPPPPRRARGNVMSVILEVRPIEYGPTPEELQRREDVRKKAERQRRLEAEAERRAQQKMEQARRRAEELERRRQRDEEVRRPSGGDENYGRDDDWQSPKLPDVVDYPTLKDKIDNIRIPNFN